MTHQRYQRYSCQGDSGSRDSQSDTRQQQSGQSNYHRRNRGGCTALGLPPHHSVLVGGGQLRHFLQAYQAIALDPWVLEVIAEGYKIEFTVRPPSFGLV